MGVRFPVGARRLSRRIDVLQRVELDRSTIEPRASGFDVVERPKAIVA